MCFLKKQKPAVFPSLPFPELVMQKKTIFKKQATPEVVSPPLQEKETFPESGLHISETMPYVVKHSFEEKSKEVAENISDLDPFAYCIELVQKSWKALKKGNLNYALIYSEELKVFYTQLSREQKERIGSSVLEVQQALEMLQLARVRKRLQKS